MPFTDACIYFIIAILGLAYPVAIQVVSRLDEKYASNNIMNMFRASFYWQAFRIMLVVTLLYTSAYFTYEEFFKSPNVAKGYHECIDYGLLLVTIALVASFLFYTKRIMLFYIPANLIIYLNTKDDNEKYEIFNVMADILYASIENKDARIANAVTSYLYKRFKALRNEMVYEERSYPPAFYEVTYQTILATADLPKKMQFIGFKAANGVWFFGERDFMRIHQETFDQLWYNLQLLVENHLDDHLLAYWKHARGYSESAFARGNTGTEENLKRAEEDKFLQFNFALGGKVLYEKRYDALKRMFQHTNSSSLKRELLPDTMSTVFNLFIRFWDPNDLLFPFRYHITRDHDLPGEHESKNWICQYIALLMYRQYTLPILFVNYNPLVVTQLPDTQDKRQLWLDNLPYFKQFVIAVANDETLLKTIGYGHLTTSWFRENGKTAPLALIDEVIEKINAHFKSDEVEQQISNEKKQQFLSKSKEIVLNRLKAYKPLDNAGHITENYDAGIIGAFYSHYGKYAFCDNQAVSSISFDRFFASRYVDKISRDLSGMFRSKIKRSYAIAWKDVITVLDRLKLDAKKHLIINFGVYIPTLKERTDSSKLSEKSYKGIGIISFEFPNRELIERTFLIINKSDLPKFFSHHISDDTVARYKLIELNADANLYGTVLDMNEHPLLKSAFPDVSQDILDKAVYLRLEMQLEVRFNKGMKCIAIHVFSDEDDQGIPDNIVNIEPF